MLTEPLALSASTYPTLDRYTGDALPMPSRPINYGTKVTTLSIEFDSGHSQRRVKAPPKATFEFQYVALSLTEYRTLRDFFMLVMNVTAFTWIDPIEKISYKVVFAQDTLTAVQKYHGPKGPFYEVQIRLVQAWS